MSIKKVNQYIPKSLWYTPTEIQDYPTTAKTAIREVFVNSGIAEDQIDDNLVNEIYESLEATGRLTNDVNEKGPKTEEYIENMLDFVDEYPDFKNKNNCV